VGEAGIGRDRHLAGSLLPQSHTGYGATTPFHTADEVYLVLAGEATLEAELAAGSDQEMPHSSRLAKSATSPDYELVSVLVLFARGG
jgi:hypothetical protein